MDTSVIKKASCCQNLVKRPFGLLNKGCYPTHTHLLYQRINCGEMKTVKLLAWRKVGEHWTRLCREAAESTFLGIFKTWLDTALSCCIWLCSEQGCWDRWSPKVPSSLCNGPGSHVLLPWLHLVQMNFGIINPFPCILLPNHVLLLS